jgi:hypothetical protein
MKLRTLSRIKSLLLPFLILIPLRSLADTPFVAPKSPVSKPFGLSAALQGGGTAAATDLSAADHNPAGIKLGKILSVEGATAWKGNNIQSSEVGVIDSVMSEVAAALKFRQTSSAIGDLERRVTLGLADDIANSGVTVGIAGDYKERPLLNDEGQIKDNGNYYELRGGVIYNFNSAFRIGARTGGHFDKQMQKEYAVGAGGLIGEHFILNGDLIVVERDPYKATIGAGVLFNKFFDLRTSYGYHLNDKKQEGAAGLFLVSSKVAIFYVANLPNLAGPELEHQIGARLNMAF